MLGAGFAELPPAGGDVTGAGLGAQYWSEDGGRWEKKQEKAAVPV